MKRQRVVIAMSGGVDSSVAAALLINQGYDVVGVMLRLWSEPGNHAHNRCCTPDSMSIARRIAHKLGIPFYAIDAQDNFYRTVVKQFFEGYGSGVTPNPCLVCNQLIRWDFLLKRARMMDADYLATGHYTRLRQTDQGLIQLLRAADRNKDQSYVLHTLNQDQLKHTIFPLGDYTKIEVRQLAREYSLPVADRLDSQDLCFLAGENYRQFLSRNRPELVKSGPIYTTAGEKLGSHHGLAFYTIGQRRGLGINSRVPLYVIEKEMHRNAVIVGTREQLTKSSFITGPAHWISGEYPSESDKLYVQIRYNSRETRARTTPREGGGLNVILEEPLAGITPGQAAVFYREDICLGGATITNAQRREIR
jgi:tRNA-specific 2-thiouridylase